MDPKTCVAPIALVALACGAPLEPVIGCDPVDAAVPICGFQNPEDLVLLPGAAGLLVSEFGAMEGTRAGALSRFDLRSGERAVVFRGGDADGAVPSWGARDCPGPPPPAFSPHGIDLSRRTDGALQLLVVQHGGRESVEFFEVHGEPLGSQLTWRGCAVPPDGSWLNDVVGLRDGGFFVTHMMPRRGGIGQFVEFAKAGLLGMETGHVLAWQEESGFEPVPGTQTTFANGLALSSDGETLFVNSSLGGGVRRVSLREGRIEARAEVPGLDNATWATDGRLWVASLISMMDVTRCGDLERGACPAAFRIVAVDPETMQTETIYEGKGPPMGGGTVGLQVGDELFIGSFAGDRILRVRLGG
jgi:hypothetical protein